MAGLQGQPHLSNGRMQRPSSPSQVAARPKNTPAPKPLTSEPADDTVNGESSSFAPTDNASVTGTPVVSEENALSPNCTSTTVEDPPVQEILTSSENNECIPSTSAELGSEARSILEPDTSNSRSSSAFEAAKSRQPDGCVDPVRQQSGLLLALTSWRPSQRPCGPCAGTVQS